MASLYARYKDWVRRNNSLLSLWETGLSSLTWVLPDRFSDSELALEAVHTAINLVSTFHDSIINESTGPGGEARGTELVFLLGALQQVQVLVELGALTLERQGRGNRYDALILVEGLKALLRMVVLYRSGGRLLTNGGLTNFEQWAARGLGAGAEARAHQVVDAFAQFRQRHCNLGGGERPAPAGRPRQGQQQGGGQRGGEKGTIENNNQAGLWWQGGEQPAPAQPASDVGSRGGGKDGDIEQQQAAVRRVERWAARRQTLAMRMVIAGELLHILRPLAYTLALRRWGRPSWRPWLGSLAMDLLSWQLTSGGAALSQSTAQHAAASPALKGSSAVLLLSLQGIRWTPDERDELTRRKLLLVYYLLRDPLFARHTGPALRRWEGLAGRLPLAGWLTSKLVEIVVGMQQYYTYTAAS